MTLVGHWPLQEDGGDALDHSGNGYHGTVNGATQGASGILGGSAYSFDGSNDGISIGNPSALSPSQFTVMAWGRVGSTGNSCAYSNGTSVELAINGDTPQFYVSTSNSNVNLHAGNTSIGEWAHVAGVFSEGTSTGILYVNGHEVARGSHSDPIDYTSNPVVIGKRGGSMDDRHFDGELADVRLYDRVLSPPEISYIYNAALEGRLLTGARTA